MAHCKKNCNHTTVLFLALAIFTAPVTGAAQDQAPAPPQTGTSTGTTKGNKVLTLADAVLLALENQPSIRAARQRFNAQGAVLGQAKSAYYPTINLNSTWADTTQSGN